jgi:hypothetical protein
VSTLLQHGSDHSHFRSNRRQNLFIDRVFNDEVLRQNRVVLTDPMTTCFAPQILSVSGLVSKRAKEHLCWRAKARGS